MSSGGEKLTGDKIISFDDVIGLQDVKDALKERLELYVKNKQVYLDAGVRPPSGVLLYGLPGTGKTMVVQACFNSLIKDNPDYVFKIMRLSDFSSSNVAGQSEKKVYSLFDKIRKDSKDWILVFDELDGICPDRGKITSVCTIERINAILQCLDGLRGHIDNVFLIATTNRPEKIDGAIKRSGRFDDIIEVKLPNKDESLIHAQRCLSGLPFIASTDLKEALGTYGFNVGWAGSEYTNFRTKLIGEFIKNDKKQLSPTQIMAIASRIKPNGKRAYPFGTV